MNQISAQVLDFPLKLQPLFAPARYKVLYGGRGSAKSWSVARALLILGMQRKLIVLCARELQNSIEESVFSLLTQQIVKMNLTGFYTWDKKHVYGSNGTKFSFEGIARNVNKVRSFEGADICWVEEAAAVTANSWKVLVPTIRKDDAFGAGHPAEIWVTFNPELETDATYKMFVKNKPTDSVVLPVNWSDNPWFPNVLRQEMEDLKKSDYDDYLHVYEGHCVLSLKGAVYAKELRAARSEDRITRVPYERTVPVDTFWDLGRADSTAIWFAQRVAMQYRVIDYLEDSQEHIGYYMKELDKLPYIYGVHHLPHDAKAKVLGAKYSVEQQVRDGGKRSVRVIPIHKVFDGINAARTIFGSCWFDEERCADGITHLQRYRYGVTESGEWSREPLHDEHSHGADAFRILAMSLKPPKASNKLDLDDPAEMLNEIFVDAKASRGLNWMGH